MDKVQEKLVSVMNKNLKDILRRVDKVEKVNKEKETKREFLYYIDDKFLKATAMLEIEIVKMQDKVNKKVADS